MYLKRRSNVEHLQSGAVLFAAMLMLLLACTVSQAAIYLPQQVSFSASDLEKAFDAGASSSAGTMSTSRRTSQDCPSNESDLPNNLLELVTFSLPTGNSSSSTTTSSAGGGIPTGGVVCALNSTVSIRENVVVGQLAEHQCDSLPDPPGTDLFRPPRVA